MATSPRTDDSPRERRAVPAAATDNGIFSDGFESGALSSWQDGVNPAIHHVLNDTTLAHSGTHLLDMTYTAGQSGGWLTRFFMPGFDSAYVSYWLRLDPNWSGTTKLLTLRGSRTDNQWSAFGNAGVCPTGSDFFATSVALGSAASNLDLSFSTYYPGMPPSTDGVSCFGQSQGTATTYSASRRLTRGAWHRIEFWVKLNTVGKSDGVQRTWLDGQLVGEWTGLILRSDGVLKLNSLMLDGEAIAPITEQLYVDDVQVLPAMPATAPPPPAPVASVAVTLNSSTLSIGQSTQAVAKLSDASGNVLTGRSVAWSSSNTSVATVDTLGLVTAVAAGTAAISATSEGVSGSAQLTISAPTDNSVFGEGFESGTLAAWQDGVNTRKQQVLNNASLAHSGTHVLQVTYPAGQSGGWLTRFFMPGYDSIFASYWVRLDPSWTGPTTLLTLRGSRTDDQWSAFGRSTDCPTGSDFFATTIKAGTSTNSLDMTFMTWYPGMPTSSDGVTCTGVGQGMGSVTYAASRLISVGAWHRLDFWVKLNTVGQSNGQQAMWLDGQLVGQWTGLTFRNDNSLKLNSLMLDGATASSQQRVLYVDDISVGQQLGASLPPPTSTVSSVSVTLNAASLTVGQSTQATATLRDASGSVLTGPTVAWSSSNSDVATADATGLIHAIGAGNATITATSQGVSGAATLTVNASAPAPVTSVTVTLNAPSLGVGQSTQAVATLRDAAGNVLTGRAISWSSSNSTVATVDVNGLVSSVAAGSTNITATSEGVTGSASLTVTPTPVASVSVAVSPDTLTSGQTAQASAILKDASGNVLTGRTVTWSSSNLVAASVSATGLITALAAGTTTITATSGGVSGSVQVVVMVVPVASIGVALGATSVIVGGTTQANAVLKDASGNVLTGRTITWSSSNTAVATVNSSGLVTAVGAGSANIVATSGGITGQASLSVTLAAVATVSVSLGTSNLIVGQTTQATAMLKDASGNVLTGRTITWASTNTVVATVSATGSVTAVATGNAGVTATA
ncbi:MAG TPA: Ig-like domain-containing protein, partial [Gemmatimonadaceae bacterium]